MTVVREKRQYWLLCFPPGVRMIRSLKNVFTLIFLQFSLPFLLVLQNAGSHLPACFRTTQNARSHAGASVILILFPNKIYSKNYQQGNSHAQAHMNRNAIYQQRGFTTSRSAKVTPLTTYMVFLHQKESSQVTNLRSKFPYSQEGIQNNFQIWKNILFYFISWTELYYLGLRNLSLH